MPRLGTKDPFYICISTNELVKLGRNYSYGNDVDANRVGILHFNFG